MIKKILVTYQIPRESIRELENYYEVTYPDKPYLSTEEILQLIPGYHGLLSTFAQTITREIIETGKNLEIISNFGVGFNNIDVETATRFGIAVCNTPNAVCEPTAELCLGLILSLTRRIAECNHRLRTEPAFEWGVMKNLGNTLSNKTLGIIGMGNIGKAVAKKALAFDMKITYHNRNRLKQEEEKLYEASYLELDELLSQADVVSLHCPLTPDTHHLIGKRELVLMKPEAYLINTARGPIVNEKAIVKALEQKEIAGAALDVFEFEPEIHPDLFDFNNTVLVPHIGTGTVETRIETGREASRNFTAFWEEKSPLNVVNPEVKNFLT